MGFWHHLHLPAFSCSSSGTSLSEAHFHLHRCHHAKFQLTSWCGGSFRLDTRILCLMFSLSVSNVVRDGRLLKRQAIGPGVHNRTPRFCRSPMHEAPEVLGGSLAPIRSDIPMPRKSGPAQLCQCTTSLLSRSLSSAFSLVEFDFFLYPRCRYLSSGNKIEV
jgi:hypothetical protein